MADLLPMNSKNKGNSFERKIANLLSTTFEAHTGIPQSFRRNIDSGSFFGGSNQQRTQTHNVETACFGDIVCPSDFAFSVECKHYKTPPTFSSMVKQENATLDSWIKQGSQDAVSSNKKMLIVAKFNLVPEMVIVEAVDTSLPSLMNYKGFKLIPLATFLEQEASYFFS
jgi:hypothetical protein